MTPTGIHLNYDFDTLSTDDGDMTPVNTLRGCNK